MISTKLHGTWVRLKGTKDEGRIGYYDKDTKLVWVVWEKGGASGHSPAALTRLTRWEPRPWYKVKGVDTTNLFD